VRRNDKKPDPAELGKLALAAKAADDRQGTAFEAKLRAETEVLEKVIELARPGLPSIVGKTSIGTGVEILDRLFLVESGGFFQLTSTAPFPLTLPEVLEYHALEDIIEALATLFRKQIIGRTAPAIEAEARTAKLTAIAKLLEGS
jgi:hypothetical protein